MTPLSTLPIIHKFQQKRFGSDTTTTVVANYDEPKRVILPYERLLGLMDQRVLC